MKQVAIRLLHYRLLQTITHMTEAQ